jgi:hypothetical protein
MNTKVYKKKLKIRKYQISGSFPKNKYEGYAGVFSINDYNSFNDNFLNKKANTKKKETVKSTDPAIGISMPSDSTTTGAIGTGIGLSTANGNSMDNSGENGVGLNMFSKAPETKNKVSNIDMSGMISNFKSFTGNKKGDSDGDKEGGGDFSFGKNSWGDGNLGKNIGMYSAGASALSGVIGGFGDDGDDNLTDGEIAADVGSAVLSGAASGAAFGPWGALAGAAIGGVTAGIEARRNRMKIFRNQWKKEKIEDTSVANNKKTSLVNKEMDALSGATQMYGNRIGGTGGGWINARKGGKFYMPKLSVHLDDTAEFNNKIHKTDRIAKPVFKRGGKFKAYKKGGKVKETENIIPNGVLHEEKNKLGDKGMPVVKCTKNSCTKHYEIERDEMILTLEATKKAEELFKKKDFKSLGDFIKEQILDNTHSYTDKYKFLNDDDTIFTKNRR